MEDNHPEAAQKRQPLIKAAIAHGEKYYQTP